MPYRVLRRLCLSTILCLFFSGAESPAFPQNRAAWMAQAHWGVMTHYLPSRVAQSGTTTVEEWNSLVDHFDVEGLARQLQSVGAGYYLITIGQNSGFYISPNTTYDRYTGIKPGNCSRRDLVADLYKALEPRGIKLMVYLPAGAPDRDPVAVKALEWKRGPYRNAEFQRKWEQIIREWSNRWGRHVAGWWFDGCYWPNEMYRFPDPPDFASFAAAARAGNPDAALAFNPGVTYPIISLSPHQDYTAGEINDPARVTFSRNHLTDGQVDGPLLHVLSYLGKTWGRGPKRFSDEDAIRWTRRTVEHGGAISWDVPIQPSGLLRKEFVEQLAAIGKAIGGR